MRNGSIRLAALIAALALAGCGRPPARESAVPADHAEAGHDAHDHDDADSHGVRLTDEQRRRGGIAVAPAGPAVIVLERDLPGEIVLDADRLAHIVPRFPGVAREVRKSLGDHVSAGEVLAVLNSNESLSTYEVNSLISGTVIEKHITLGEFVRDDQDIYVVADLTSVWVNVSVYARDLGVIRKGLPVRVTGAGSDIEGKGTIGYLGPLIGEATRTATARVVLDNRSGAWRPGQFVTVRVGLDEAAVAVAVPDAALQRMDGRTVVFVEADGAFEPRPVTTGRSDGTHTEIVAGLAAGTTVVTAGAFLVKSELTKSEAGHDH
jgi:cobalt-zinc-cadmium efflux system membrane fusion protein